MYQQELFDARVYGGAPVTVWRVSVAVSNWGTGDSVLAGVLVRCTAPTGGTTTCFKWGPYGRSPSPQDAKREALRWVGEILG